MSNDNVVDINSRVDVDLDAEQSKLDKKPDFYFTRNGRTPAEGHTWELADEGNESHWKPVENYRIRVTDPNLVDWRILATLEEEVEILGHIIPDEEHKEFLRHNAIPIAVLAILVEKIIAHFGRPKQLGTGKRLPI